MEEAEAGEGGGSRRSRLERERERERGRVAIKYYFLLTARCLGCLELDHGRVV